MAVKSITVTESPNGNDNAALVAWSALTNTGSDTGTPWEAADFADCTVQFGGTFGAGGTVVLEGSNDGSTYATLTDSAGSAISITAAGVKLVSEKPRYIRPRVSAGDGTTSITVTMYARRNR